MRIAPDGLEAGSQRAMRARGFSLIELMVALMLGLVVTCAVIATFVSVHSASRDTAGVAQLADSGRIALDILQQTVRTAGYMACNTTKQQAVAFGGAPAADLTDDFTEALSGYEAAPGGTDTGPGSTITLVSNPTSDTSTGDWTTTAGLGNALDASVIEYGTPNALPISGSDVIAVHTTYSQVIPVYTTGASGASSVDVTATTNINPGAYGIVSNCAYSVVDQIDNVSNANGNPEVTFDQPLGQSFDAGAHVAVADTIVFYIGTGADGDGALYSYSLAGTGTFQQAAEVAPDVENMQILYGVDTNGSMSATEYVTADQVSNVDAGNANCQPVAGTGAVDFNCVVSVKIALLVASPLYATQAPAKAPTFNLLGTMVTAPIDTRMRRVFETTISLRDNTH